MTELSTPRVKKWVENHKDRYNLLHRNAQKTYSKNNQEKINAHKIGQKLRGKICEKCGVVDTRLEAHHFDYSQPNKIITLCVKCHKGVHNG